MSQGTSVQYVAILTDGGAYPAHFGRAKRVAVFGIQDGHVSSREDRLDPYLRSLRWPALEVLTSCVAEDPHEHTRL